MPKTVTGVPPAVVPVDGLNTPVKSCGSTTIRSKKIVHQTIKLKHESTACELLCIIR